MRSASSASVKIFYPRYRRDELIALLSKRLPALEGVLPIKRAVLFGSWAAGKHTAFSDIDLLVIYGGPSRADAYRLVRRALGLRGLEPHVYSEAEAEGVGATLAHMAERGVVLLG